MSSSSASIPRTTPLPPLRVSVNATATLVGNLVHTLCQAGLLIALTRLGQPAMVGQFALGLAISGPIMLLASLQLRSVQITDARGRNQFSEYLALRLTTSVLALAVIAAAALIAGNSVTAIAVIILVGILKNVEAVADVYRGVMQRSERMERVAISMIMRGVISVPVFAGALYLGAGLIGALTALIVVNFVVWWTWDVHNARLLSRERHNPGKLVPWFGFTPHFERTVLLTLTRTALPLGVVAMLLSLNSYAPQLAIKHFAGEAELGIFAALLYAAMATRVLVGAAGQSASPRLARLYEDGNQRGFRKLHHHLLAFGLAVSLTAIAGAVLLGEPVLRLVFGAEYAARNDLFIQLSIVSGVIHLVSLQGYTVTATRSFRAQLPVSILVAVTTLTVAWFMVPAYGVAGAGAAMLGGALVQGSGYSLLLRRALHRLQRSDTSEQVHVIA